MGPLRVTIYYMEEISEDKAKQEVTCLCDCAIHSQNELWTWRLDEGR